MLRFAVIAAFGLMLGASAAQAAPTPAEILAQSKAAIGGAAWDNVRITRTKGRIETSGLKGPIEMIEDGRTGAFVNTYDLGAVKGADGYDGKTPWNQDTSGQVAIEGGDA